MRANTAALMHRESAEIATLNPKHIFFNISFVSDFTSGGVIKIYDLLGGIFGNNGAKFCNRCIFAYYQHMQTFIQSKYSLIYKSRT